MPTKSFEIYGLPNLDAVDAKIEEILKEYNTNGSRVDFYASNFKRIKKENLYALKLSISYSPTKHGLLSNHLMEIESAAGTSTESL